VVSVPRCSQKALMNSEDNERLVAEWGQQARNLRWYQSPPGSCDPGRIIFAAAAMRADLGFDVVWR
jgi:hypothetical protein